MQKGSYGLKQTPQTQYSHIESSFDSHAFVKYPYEHTLFAKYSDGGKILIFCLYIDYLIYASNDVDMIYEFQYSMKKV